MVAAGLVAASLSGSPADALVPGPPSVLHVGQIARQDVPALPGSEPDTLVEPDVGVSPVNGNIAVAVAHDGRYPDGGAVGIETSWTHDGGATWHHRPLPGVTAATGGARIWERASDPVVAFGPNGVVYVSTLVFNTGCDSGVLVSKSVDGGKTFAKPTVAHRSASCDISDDKNWLVVDNGPTSPHRGRLYQFWTPFLTDMFGNADGSPQALVYSDDAGATWSAPVNVSPPHANTQNSQPMLKPNGTIVDSYIDYGPNGSAEGPEAAEARATHRKTGPTPRTTTPKATAASTYPALVTVRSSDGGDTWSPGGTITRDLGDGPPDIRCCLPSAVADPVTGRLFASWNSVDPTKIKLSSSDDGKRWSAPVVVNRADKSLLGVSSDVSAYNGTVSVAYGLTNAATSTGRFGRQFVATSRDGGRHFLQPTPIGPQTNYAYAAVAGGIFPGDYIGTAITKGRLYAVWAVSSKPPTTGATYHQVIYGASFDTNRSPIQVAAPPDAKAAVTRP
ncbi:sialidase family protein [Microlunatus ginsengisoli]|uniref:Sialidase family protein n=1 Tax=Microlunatus ginsengisoli TaxID=363863 RepID=A0ABP7AR70_9ACTN